MMVKVPDFSQDIQVIILIHNSQDMPSELNKLGDYTYPIGEPFLTQCLVLSEFSVIYLINLKIIQNLSCH